MQATGVQVPSAAPRRMDGRVAYGGGLLNRRGRAVLRWFESSSILQQAGVAQWQSTRLLSDGVGVRILSPAYQLGLPREAWEGWRNGKRSGLRPRGHIRPWEFDSPSREQTDKAFGPESLG